jgi:hypothetical protein
MKDFAEKGAVHGDDDCWVVVLVWWWLMMDGLV